jgi:hypothetical protein
MKYRWTTQVMTRTNGVLMVYCSSKEQAEKNVDEYVKALTDKNIAVRFHSINNLNNATLISEIVSVTVGDGELCKNVRIEDICIHKELSLYADEDKNDEPEYPTAYNTDEDE